MGEKAPTDLNEYLLSKGVDLSVHKPDITELGDAVEKASTAWTNNKEGIKAIVENRMQKLREEIIFSCVPQELLVKREALVELSKIFGDFEACVQESKKRAENKESEAEEEPATEVEEEPLDDNSSM